MLYLETQILLKLYMFYWFINSQCMAAGCLMNTCFSPLTRWKYRLKKRKHTFWRETVRTRPTSSEINQWNQLIMMHFSRRRPPPSAVVIMAPSEGVRRRTFTLETAVHSEVTPCTLRDRACISDVVILSHVFLNPYQTASGWWWSCVPVTGVLQWSFCIGNGDAQCCVSHWQPTYTVIMP